MAQENISLYDVLDTKEIDGMGKSLKIILSRMGVQADFYLTELKIYDGRLLVKVKSTEFNTTPVLFKAIHVEGEGFVIRDKEHDGVLRLSINLSYRFNCFSGGENGANIGVCQFVIFAGTKRVACNGLTLRD